MKTPSLEEAERFLAEAETLNPGPWVPHSKNVARAAKIIASHHPRLDACTAYVFGNAHTLRGWEARFQIKADIEAAIGCSIYQILPGVIEGTFGLSPENLH